MIGKLFAGPLDIVGDVHGEFDALRSLLKSLGYDDSGAHPQGRRLVFIGDLIDRGPDSPAVIEWVQERVEAGLAQCILGNHELNVMRLDAKSGNGWLINPGHPEQQPGGDFAHSRVATPGMRERYLAFFATLPLALEREELRVVHAAWITEAVQSLRGLTDPVLAVYDRYARAIKQELQAEGVTQRAHAQNKEWHEALHQRDAEVPLLKDVGEFDSRLQMGNPVRILTSGVERVTTRPFFSAGKWRMCDRVRWWDAYMEEPAVVIGHYWRRLRPLTHPSQAEARPPNLFAGVAPNEWMGPKRNVFCIDYSVGGRYEERKRGITEHATQLCALRWPEREVWGEQGRLLL